MAEPELLLDSNIRLWVILPIVFITFLVGVIRHYVSILLQSDKKLTLEQVSDSQVLIRSRILRENGKYIPKQSFLMRKFFFNNQDDGFFKKTKRKVIPPSPMTDPSMLTDMMKGNVTNVLPMLLIGGWINWTFSGFVTNPEKQTLKEHLIDELDYVLVPTEAWHKLMSWYGCVEGQRPIVRKVVEHGMFVKHCKVEVYLLELNLCENDNMDDLVKRHFSKADTIDTVEKDMRALFNISADKEIRLWNKYMSNTYEQLNKPDSTVQDAGLFQGQVLVIEKKNEDGTWPRQTSYTKSSTATSRNLTTSSKLPSNSTATNSTATISSTITNGDSNNSSYTLNNSTSSNNRVGGYSSYGSSYSYREPQTQPGLCGLSNLGNTCFMNSALQCLSNAAPLTEYFLQDEYEAEINRDNPLGMRGEIAEAYADLTQVGRFAPQFSGYQQQDSQELLAFLLDGLHEDLNRVKKKPYLALKDAEGRPDEIVAKEAWTNHRLRNDSIIVDTVHGLFKSTLVCPECAMVSVTFDPFCYLTLPLPMKKDRTMEVFLVRADPQSRPMQYRVVVPKLGTVADLCTTLSKLSGVLADNMVVADVYNHRFHKIYRRDEGLNHIMDRDDIFLYEVEELEGEQVSLPIYFRERRMKHTGSSTGTVLFGQPLLISFPKQNLTVDLLYERVQERIGGGPTEAASSSRQHSQAGTSNGPNGVCEGEDEEMEHQEVARPNQDIFIEPGNGQSEGSVREEDCEDPENVSIAGIHKTSAKSANCPAKLFTFSMVNSYGTADISSLTSDNTVLKLNGEDEEMEHQEVARPNQDIFIEPGNGQSEGSVREEDCEDPENVSIAGIHKTSAKSANCPAKLFTFSMVNSYGTADISSLTSDNTVLKLNAQSTVAIDWDSESKKLYYDDQEAEAYEKHESMLQHQKKAATVALRDCIELFTTMETLGEHDPWYCPTCKKHQQATKKFDLWSLPRILVVHLKRFSYNRCWRDKLDTVVDFPVRDLNMSEFVSDPKAGPYIYDLIAVSNHYGGMGGGHYTAYAKNKADELWYYFDDSSVSSASEDQIVTKAAYVLFYQRRDNEQETSSHCKVDCPSSSNTEEALTQDLLEIIESSGIQTLEDLVGKLEFENELNRVCNNPSQRQGGGLSQMLEDNVINLTPRTSEDNNMIEAVLDMEQEYDLSMYYSNLFS
ncbi:UNVERIFIED_CONTAM: hypothetical protein FKN15_002093 [Acipenser sinensis]